jgi:hypothetical protein
MNPTALAQLTHLHPHFAHLAATLVGEIRRKLCVPEHADDDVEAEFVALRQRVDGFYPEFCAISGSALLGQLGPQRLEEALAGLNTEAAQRYLEAASRTQLEFEQSIPALRQKLAAAARGALASPALSPALSSSQQSALGLARDTGIERALSALAQAVTRQVLLEHGASAAQAQLLASPAAQRVQRSLLATLAVFHARLFIRHVGEPHVAAVVAELKRKPLRDYVFARCATELAVDRQVNQLFVRIAGEVL